MFFDPTYLCFMAPGLLLVMFASWYVNSAYRKWGRVPVRSGMTGAEAAQRLIMSGGLNGVQVQGIGGQLTDNYDPRDKVLRLSEGVANTASVASVAVAAHELGHAMQDADGYFPLRFRAALVPAVNIGSWLGWILIFAGILLKMTNLAWIGILVFSGGALFALATLPVELNASARAKRRNWSARQRRQTSPATRFAFPGVSPGSRTRSKKVRRLPRSHAATRSASSCCAGRTSSTKATSPRLVESSSSRLRHSRHRPKTFL